MYIVTELNCRKKSKDKIILTRIRKSNSQKVVLQPSRVGIFDMIVIFLKNWNFGLVVQLFVTLWINFMQLVHANIFNFFAKHMKTRLIE